MGKARGLGNLGKFLTSDILNLTFVSDTYKISFGYKLTLSLLTATLSSVDKLCTHIEPRSGPIEHGP